MELVTLIWKYIVFPNVAFSVYNGALSILKCGDKVRLLFWGEDGKPSEKFPEDIQ